MMTTNKCKFSIFILAAALYSTSVFANQPTVQQGTNIDTNSSSLIQLAKGQAYVPPQNKEKICG